MLILDDAAQARLRICTAESCTGGLLAGLLTDIPGSSAVFERGFVTYSNAAKAQMLGVDPELIDLHGAVSRSVAEAMAKGALETSGAGLAASVTGIAGPTGGTMEKPVGLVHFAVAHQDGRLIHREERFGDIGRDSVRLESVRTALRMMVEMLA